MKGGRWTSDLILRFWKWYDLRCQTNALLLGYMELLYDLRKYSLGLGLLLTQSKAMRLILYALVALTVTNQAQGKYRYRIDMPTKSRCEKSFSEIQKLADAAIKDRRSDYKHLAWAAYCYNVTGRRDLLVDLSKRELDIFSNSIDGQVALGFSLWQLGLVKECGQVLKELAAANPTDMSVEWALAEFQMQSCDHVGAKSTMARIAMISKDEQISRWAEKGLLYFPELVKKFEEDGLRCR